MRPQRQRNFMVVAIEDTAIHLQLPILWVQFFEPQLTLDNMKEEAIEDPLKDLRDEVLRRVGRNLVMFQQIERLMKLLLAKAKFETGPTGPTARHVAHQNAIQKKTLGQLTGELLVGIFTEPVEKTDDEQISEMRMRTSIRFSYSDADQFNRDQVQFAAMVDERNELVHHFLERYQLTDAVSLDAALIDLDEQRERALDLRQRLEQLHDSFLEVGREMAAFLQSPVGKAEIKLMMLRSSKIVRLLAQATQKSVRQDGWTLLSSAGNFIAAEDPAQLPSIKQHFGHRGLQSLVAASDLFDLREEVTANGGKRMLYRIKSGVIEPA